MLNECSPIIELNVYGRIFPRFGAVPPLKTEFFFYPPEYKMDLDEKT
jgi:hypothetical protein